MVSRAPAVAFGLAAAVAAGRRGRVAGSVLSDEGLAAGRVAGLRAGRVAGFFAGAGAFRAVSRGAGCPVCCADAFGTNANVSKAVATRTAVICVRRRIFHLYGRRRLALRGAGAWKESESRATWIAETAAVAGGATRGEEGV